MKPTVITSGVDSEYVLGGLASALQAAGYGVHELDFGVIKHDVRPFLEQFSQAGVAYVTSAHTNLTSRLATSIAPHLIEKYPNYLSPLEVMAHLKPSRTFYVPHDLLSPFGDSTLDEYRFLDLYDHILAPFEVPDLQSRLGKHTRVHVAGWIKYRADSRDSHPDLSLGSATTPRVAVFLSFVEHFQKKFGAAGTADYFKPILTPNVRVKLPVWHGIEEMERAIRDRTNATVVSARCPSTSLIDQSDIVLCNGASSILAESILSGVPAICLLDSEAEPMETKQEKLKHFPQIVFHDYQAQTAVPSSLIDASLSRKPTRQLTAFDFKLVERLLRE